MHEEARNVLEQGLKLNPNSHVAYETLGQAYEKLYNSAKAIECFQKSLAINPKQITTLNRIGTLFSHLGKNDDALKHFRKILEIKPNAYSIHRHISLVTNYKLDKSHIYELEAMLRKVRSYCGN